MNFYIDKIILFNKKGKFRELCFCKNKVNVITGGSNTGKSAIFDIIKYCLLSSSAEIPDEAINDNVEWYCLTFHINEKHFCIARKSEKHGSNSDQYFFDSMGKIPSTPKSNISYAELNDTLKQEFSLEDQFVIPYGGKSIKKGSKISFRYFLLFNSLSENIVDHKSIYFDYDQYENTKYKEALNRIFNIAIGAENEETVILKELFNTKTNELGKLERKLSNIDKKDQKADEDRKKLLNQALELGLVDDIDESVQANDSLKAIYGDTGNQIDYKLFQKKDTLLAERRSLKNRLINLQRLKKQYDTYNKNITETENSLHPINYIYKNYYEIIEEPHLKELLDILKDEYNEIKTKLSEKKPFNTNINREIRQLRNKITKLTAQIESSPTKFVESKSNADQLLLLGEIRGKLNSYATFDEERESINDEIGQLEREVEELNRKIGNIGENIDLRIRMLEEYIESYSFNCESLGIYQNYRAYFNTRSKRLQLRDKKEGPISNIGSSSNHLFLHICLFLGMHKLFLDHSIKYIPSFLIIDQVSRPYYDNVKKERQLKDNDSVEIGMFSSSDRTHLTNALTLLNNFIAETSSEEQDFQIILLEHVSPSVWEDAKLGEFHLVDEFREGKALVPPSMVKKKRVK